MPRAARCLAIAIAIAIAGCSPKQELGLTHIPPVLASELDIASAAPQVREFEFDVSGTYELRYTLSLRHGPGSSPGSHELAGVVAIHDADHASRFEQSFRERIGPNQVGGILLSFDSGSLAGPDPHMLSMQLESSPGLVENYTDLQIFLKRQPAFPILD